MNPQLLAGVALSLSMTVIATPAHAKFEYRNLPVYFDCSNEFLQGSKYCPIIIKVDDIKACNDAGGQIGAIGTRPVCANEKLQRGRPRVGPPPFFPEDVAAKSFVPVTVPTGLYNGQKDPKAAQ